MEDIRKEKAQLKKQKGFQLADRPQRSKQQSGMTKTNFVSNMYEIEIQGLKGRYMYSFKILDPVSQEEIPSDARKLRWEIITKAQKQVREHIGPHIARGLNITSFRPNEEAKRFSIENVQHEGKKYEIDIALSREVDLTDIVNKEGTGNEVTQVMNFVFKKIFQEMKFQEKGRVARYYDPNSWKQNEIRDYKLNIGRGFLTSAQIWQNQKMYMLLDVCSKIVRQETAFDAIRKLQNGKRTLEQIKEELVGYSVMASYGNERNYIVTDINFKINPMSTFDCKGSQKSYFDYYKKQYGITIKDKNQPLLETQVKMNIDGQRVMKQSYLIPELVRMTGLPDEMVKDFKCMQAIAQYTKLSPEKRMEEIHQQAVKMSQKLGNDYKMNTAQYPQLEGYTLKRPEIQLANKNTIDISKNENFNINKPIITPLHLKKNQWIIMYNDNNNEQLDILIDNLMKNCKQLGMKVEEPICIGMKQKDKFSDWQRELEYEIEDAQKDKVEIQVVVSLLPNRTSPLYNQLKHFLISKAGIIHQNVCAQSLRKNVGSICANILLQINAKMGKPIWYVERPASMNPKTMLIGIDVFHSNKSNSFVGFVSSCDPRHTKYNCQISRKSGRYEEFLENMDELLYKAIFSFYEETGKKFLPESIIIFRDGVGESQIDIVAEMELKKASETFEKEELNKLNGGKPYKPEFAFIVVNKKINQRFFAKNGNRIDNPQSGSLVKDKITSTGMDFYLANQRVTQGTCTPTYYQVLKNDTKLTEEDFYKLCYYQSFNYYNWRGPVRVPAPCQYAHKLAFLSGQVYKGLKQDLKPHANVQKKHYAL